jgi:hypothetical protein
MVRIRTSIRTILVTAVTVSAVFVSAIYMSCNKDRCKNVVCYNNGTCNSSSGSCTCATGYEDPSCQTASRLKFIANWGVINSTTTDEPAKFSVGISEGTVITGVVITNFHAFFTAPINATIKGDSIIIPVQTIQGKVVQGSGYIYSTSVYGINGAISINYSVTDVKTFATQNETETWNG